MKRYADIIIAPVITEKSMANKSQNVYTFKVASNATKRDIKWAVEKAFNVTVKSINTLNTKTKRRRVGRYAGTTKAYKKAIVTLADGQSIEI